MKSTVVFLVLFLFLVITAFPANSQKINEYRAKQVATKEILQENTDILEFFWSLETEGQDLLNSILQENYRLGYYTEAFRLSKNTALEERLSKTKERLQELKEGGLYQIILHKAKNATKTHLLRYLVRRHEAGTIHGGAAASQKPIRTIDFFNEGEYWDKLFFGRVYAQVNKETWTPLEPKEVFPVVKEKVKKNTSIARPERSGNKREIILNWGAIGKFSLIGVLILLVTATIVMLIGACRYPHLPVFRQVRELLEQ